MRDDHGCPSIILEAIASQDLWIWHAYFGMPGANNDLNVLNSSPLLNDMENGVFPQSSFFCNDNEYAHGYYLADEIYPEWPVFMQTITCPTTFKRKRFQVAQEGARKDIERTFGVLKKRFHIIKNPARAWHPKKIRSVMYACIIIYNMILECEGKSISPFVPDEDEAPSPFDIDDPRRDNQILALRNKSIHESLKADLVEHIERVRTDIVWGDDVAGNFSGKSFQWGDRCG
ncbi:hypothetical protein E3N88_12934 [Mikania micrantha]|uniref:DDE Tnp4 domain-containing protein n=1 Tax=Mikania micrantha TaxID=192012 RepID=A0A5N6P6Z8_9ASTR|nr:hypothetical protein E3N88_12934 [Mikania micrantha]